jgi:hypothetical protein
MINLRYWSIYIHTMHVMFVVTGHFMRLLIFTHMKIGKRGGLNQKDKNQQKE